MKSIAFKPVEEKAKQRNLEQFYKRQKMEKVKQ